MQIPSDLTIIPVNTSSTVSSEMSSANAAVVATSASANQSVETASASMQAPFEWLQEHESESTFVTNTSLDNELSNYILNNFKIQTEPLQLPQTGAIPQAAVLDESGAAASSILLSEEQFPATSSLNGNYTMTAVQENGTLTVTARQPSGVMFQSVISEYALSAFSPGDTITLSFQGPGGASLQLSVTVPAEGAGALAELLSSMTLTLSGGETQKPAVFSTVASFPGTLSVPVTAETETVTLANGITVYLNQPEALESNPLSKSAKILVNTSGTSQSTAQPAMTRMLLYSADHIEAGSNSPNPIFSQEDSPVFAAFTLADISADSPMISAGGGTLQLFFSSTGSTAVFTLLAGSEQYVAQLSSEQLAAFLQQNLPAQPQLAGFYAQTMPVQLIFSNISGLPDTITLSLLIAAASDDYAKRTQSKEQPRPEWKPDAATLGLAGSASVPVPKNLKLRRAARRTLLGKLTLTASVLSLHPVGGYLGSVTALLGSMAQADQDDALPEEEPDFIPDVSTAKERAALLNQALLRHMRLSFLKRILPQQVYSLLT